MWEFVRRVAGRLVKSFVFFVIGGYESYFMVSFNGDCKVIGSRNKGNHENKCADSRASITAYRNGAVSGDQGATVILTSGARKRSGYSDKFLYKHGLAKRSTIIMTESTFMTTHTWDPMTPKLLKGYRSMPYLKESLD